MLISKNSMKKTKDYTSFNFRIENSILKKLEEIAKKEDRTMASLIRMAINELIESYKKVDKPLYLKKYLTNKKDVLYL